ncbi:hypothetical protein [Pedobacter alpinus]|uniref:Helicase XPB/Ssl2 N-terminal domain-containing protein n=1 Tax=Pedobacter alpinus TaxID=1590643 RepID=A0ABW5TV28_9SPHI
MNEKAFPTQEFKNLLNDCTRDEIDKFWFFPIRKFLSNNINLSWEKSSVIKILGNVDLKKTLQKVLLIDICTRFYSDENAIALYLDYLPNQLKNLLIKAVWTKKLDRLEIEKIIEKPVLVENSLKYSWNEDYIPELKIFIGFLQSERHYHNFSKKIDCESKKSHPVYFSLPTNLRIILARAVPKPDGYYLLPTNNIDKELSIYNFEPSIFSEFDLLITYYLQGNIKYSAKGMPNKASIKKMNKVLHLKEFFPDMDLRVSFICGLIADDFKVKSLSLSKVDILKNLFESNFLRIPTAPYILKRIKGLSYFFPSDFINLSEVVVKIFKSNNVDGWISFKNLLSFTDSHFIDLNPLRAYFDIDRLYYTDENNDAYYIPLGEVKNYIEHPFLAGHLFIMASFGLLELALDPTDKLKYSEYDGLRYFKFTNLGKYILGLTDGYTPLKNEETQTQLHLESDSLVIRVEGNIDYADTILENYARKVSTNRYLLSSAKFLDSCKTHTDIKNKIALFKQTIDIELPQFWESYFNKLLDNSKALKPVKDVLIYKLPPQEKELHRLVAQDAIISKYVIKAEKFNLIISKLDFNAFCNRMKELGYLVN